jgi:hypothetical protein
MLPAGQYTVTELPETGYTPSQSTFLVTVPANGTADWTFVNYPTPMGWLTVRKDVCAMGESPACGTSDPHPFTIRIQNVPPTPTYDVTATISEPTPFDTTLPAGEYTVTELPEAGYTPLHSSFFVTVPPGGFADWTFVNFQSMGQLTVRKDVCTLTGDCTVGDPRIFTIEIQNVPPTATYTAIGTISETAPFVTTLPAGQYTVTELPEAGYAPLQPSFLVTMPAGGTSDWTFVNFQVPL